MPNQNRARFPLALLLTLLMCPLPPLLAQPQATPRKAMPAPTPALAAASTPALPLPEIPTLMHQVEQHQKLAEALQRDYTYRSATRFERLDKNGHVKDVDSRVSDVFYLEAIPVQRTLEHNGKPLSLSDQKKQDDRIDKQVAKAKERLVKASQSGKPTDSSGDPVITVSRLLELGSFTHPRRVQINGRDTIVVDFAGDPNAKTRNPSEAIIHDMAGTIWIDEEDRAIEHLQGYFTKTFKIGGGVVADITQGTNFTASNVRINNEVWLPAAVEAHGHIRFLLFFNINGNFSLRNSDYRKFKVTSTILPSTAVAASSAQSTPSKKSNSTQTGK